MSRPKGLGETSAPVNGKKSGEWDSESLLTAGGDLIFIVVSAERKSDLLLKKIKAERGNVTPLCFPRGGRVSAF